MLRPSKSPLPDPRFGFFFTSSLLYFLTSFFSSGCSCQSHADPSSLTLIIESNPTNLDPRFATDREALIGYLLHGQARVANGILPPNHWAYEPNVTQYTLDAARAEKLLDAAGFPRRENGYRFHLTLKTSTDEQYRLIAAALQDQWRRVGIDLELRPLELATLLSDAVKGNFQLNLLRWVGANTDPDIFEFVYSTKRFPPDGANRGHYRNARIDALTDQIHVEMDQEKRKALCSEVQRIIAEDLPYLPLWFYDVVSVHRRSLGELNLSPTGDLDFLSR